MPLTATQSRLAALGLPFTLPAEPAFALHLTENEFRILLIKAICNLGISTVAPLGSESAQVRLADLGLEFALPGNSAFDIQLTEIELRVLILKALDYITIASGGGGGGTSYTDSQADARVAAGIAALLAGAATFSGALAAPSVNKVVITPVATGSTLTLVDGKTVVFSNTFTLAGTDGTTLTFPPVSASLGYLGVPSNTKSANYTCVLADVGQCLLHPLADANARTFTIDSHVNVAWPDGACISFQNMSVPSVTISVTTDPMNMAGSGATGSRTLLQYGFATVRYTLATNSWFISGTNLN